MAGGFGEGCVCMMFMCVVLNSQGGYARHIHSNLRRFYRCLALTSTVMVAHLSLIDGGMAMGAVSGSRATIRPQYPGLASFLSSSSSVGKLTGRERRGSLRTWLVSPLPLHTRCGCIWARDIRLEPRLSRRDTQGGTDPRLDGLTYPAYVTILNTCLHTCMADAYNGQGYDREGAHR
jgi:hypothetical protein